MTDAEARELERRLLAPPPKPKPVEVSPPDDATVKYTPTQDAIRAECEAMQKTWSDQVRAHRAGYLAAIPADTHRVTVAHEAAPLTETDWS